MILITGHKGFIGSKLYERLVNEGKEVIGIDLKDGQDILDFLPEVENVEYVFHMAALPRVEFSVINPSYTMRHNVLATSKLLEWSAKKGVKRFIFSSSSAIYGNGDLKPQSPYGLHKKMCEEECELYSSLYKLDTVSLRYFNVYSEDQPYGGSYSTIVSAWMHKIKNNQPLIINGDGNNKRDYIHVNDIVDANIFIMNYNKKLNGTKFDVGTGTNYSVNYIKEYIKSIYGDDTSFTKAAARKGDPLETIANITKLSEIGWTSKINFKDGLKKCFMK